MTDRRDIDPEEAAQITERIGQSFNFVRDAIANPRMLEEIPNGSKLRFRDILCDGQGVRLTAYLPNESDAQWDARVSGPVTDAIPERSLTAKHQPPWFHEGRYLNVAGYDTAEAALDALEAAISSTETAAPITRRAAGD
jgi:hypothetical protein